MQRCPSSGSRRLRPAAATVVLVSVLSSTAASVRAASVYYKVKLTELKLADGAALPKPVPGEGPAASRAMRPHVVVDGDGEAYFTHPQLDPWTYASVFDELSVAVRAEAGRDATGVVVVPAADLKGMTALKFSMPATAARDEARDDFFRAKLAHYEQLLARQAPGGAWFRAQAQQARHALGQRAIDAGPANPLPAATASLDETYSLFSGGRALSENLQLDRTMPANRQREEPTIPIDSLPGITVKEFDWAKLNAGKRPELDPLAAFVPADQHAVFFPSFAAMVALLDEVDARGVPVLQALEPRAEDAMTKERYQRQLCLSMTGLGRMMGPHLIDAVAVTGSDAYLRVGSDVAVLFEAKDPGTLTSLLSTQVNLRRQTTRDAEAVQGKTAAGLAYFGARSPDRSVSVYVAQLPESRVVVVTNSLPQLERLAATRGGSVPALSTAPEYTYFRDRYKRGADGESAFVVLTDATIRRWCGPRWRILDARRTQAAAVLAELQAKYARDVMANKVEPVELRTDRPVVGIGTLRLTHAGVSSSTYGSLEFLTPVGELPSDKVTREEAEFYGRWRDGYQRNWSNYFDPIAIRLSAAPGKLAADVTVMPLIDNTRYRDLRELSSGVQLAPTAGDPHDALIHFAVALNRNSAPVQQFNGMAKQIAPGVKIDPLGWLGKALAVYVDDDPVWQEAAKSDDPEAFWRANYPRLPVALYVESDSPFKLAAFMAGVRGYVDQTAPNVLTWEAREHDGQSYVCISSKSGFDGVDRVRLYYATIPEALVLSPNEAMVKRCLDRHAARRAAKDGKGDAKDGAAAAAKPAGDGAAAAAPAAQPTTKPAAWLGQSAAVRLDAQAVDAFRQVTGQAYREQMQRLAWNNLPALNEWRRLYPDQDPVKVHQRLWQVRLVDPAGGQYVWNEQYRTMESTTYGHPAAPKAGPGLPPQAQSVTGAAMGLTFEEHGVRAKVELDHK